MPYTERRKELYQLNKNEINKKRKDDYHNNSEVQKKHKDSDKRYYKLHKKKILANRRTFYQENKEKIDTKHDEWKKNNPNKIKIYQDRYYLNHVIEKKERCRIYRNTENGKLVRARCNRKRDGEFKCIELFLNPFPSDVSMIYHHINNIITIPFPEIIHLQNYGNKHKEKCNIWIQKLYGLNINKILVIEGWRPEANSFDRYQNR
jgi:hypothetical protein